MSVVFHKEKWVSLMDGDLYHAIYLLVCIFFYLLQLIARQPTFRALICQVQAH